MDRQRDVPKVGLPRSRHNAKGERDTVPDSPSPDWRQLVGPTDWFQIACPPDWKTEVRDNAVSLRPDDFDTMLVLSGIWNDAAQSPSSIPRLADVVAQFPKTRNVKSKGGLQHESLVESLAGEAVLAAPTSIWQRLGLGNEWWTWRMWAFREAELTVVATLMFRRDPDRELVAMTEQVLTTLKLAEQPAAPPEVFATMVLDLAKQKFPLLRAELGQDFHLTLGDSRLNLFNFYRAYVRSPKRFQAIVLPALTTVVQVQEWGEEQTNPPLDAVSDRVLPMLYPEVAWQRELQDFVANPWVAGLVILYVIDESNAYWYVRHDLLDQWEVNAEDLHSMAIANLETYFENQPMEMAVASTEGEDPTLLMPAHPDSYNAARLLSERFLTRVREFVGGDVAVGIPGRDFMVGVSMKAPQLVEHIRRRVAEDYEQTDHPLTNRLLLVTADGVSELPPDT